MLEEGTAAPDLELGSTVGRRVRLGDFRGRPTVLYFYPEDHTVGCTLEARGFRAYFEALGRRDVAVLGVSRDNLDNHCSFQERNDLPFDLLSDPDGAAHDAFDAWRETAFRKRRVPRRCTYLIDPDGRIAKTYPRVNVLGHARQVMEDVERLGARDGWFSRSADRRPGTRSSAPAPG